MRLGIEKARGNLIVFFPGDSEYRVQDLPGLVGSLVNSGFRAVFGTRAVKCTDLTDRLKQMAGTLSGGWKQRLALACATAHRPDLLFLDEPTAGVDPAARRTFWETIYRLAERGTTVLVTTHYMDEAERCQRLAFLSRGQLIALGTPKEITTQFGTTNVEEVFVMLQARDEAERAT